MPRPRKFSARSLEGAILSLVLPMVASGATEVQPARIYLHKNWQVQSSCEVKASGEQISSVGRSEEHTSELQSLAYLVCRLLLEKKKKRPEDPAATHIFTISQ